MRLAIPEHNSISVSHVRVDLPAFDRASNSITEVKTAICITAVIIVLCWACGIYILITGWMNLTLLIHLSDTEAEMLTWIFTFMVTTCSDSLGFAHATSLRWALYNEGRLEYNTNFRFFVSSKRLLANKWYMNLFTVFCVLLCYGCTATVVVFVILDKEHGRMEQSLNGLALILLGVGLTGQICSTLLCLRYHELRIPTWSSHPLTNVLATISTGTILIPVKGRCMHSVSMKDDQSQAIKPSQSQPRLFRFRHSFWIVIGVWIAWAVSLGWYIIAMTHMNSPTFTFDLDPGQNQGVLLLGMSKLNYLTIPNAENSIPLGIQFVLSIIFFSSLQTLVALALHCVELLVNMNRDEVAWRRATSPGGARLLRKPLTSALTSWYNLVLLTLKSGTHWLLGRSLLSVCGFMDDDGFTYIGPHRLIVTMSPARILLFSCGLLVAAMFATYLAFAPCKGPQPCAWGHLQTLADLIDDWELNEGRLWWGDKGGGNGLRHAGTASTWKALGPIDPTAVYI